MELYQDTIIKLVTRQGSDSDRKHILLYSGEPAYTTDTKRLFIGDGVLSGGNVVGNMYKGKASDIRTLAPCLPGDFVYWTDKGNLYALKPGAGDGSDFDDWDLIGGGYYAGSKYISISSNNVIYLNPLSSYSLDPDIVNMNGFLELSGGKLTVTLSALQPLYFDGNTIKLASLSAYSLSNDVVTAPITIKSGRLTLNKLSANSLSNDVVALSSPVFIDSSGRLDIHVQSPLTVNSNVLGVSLSALFNLVYPIGSVYYSATSNDPSLVFVGTTWTQIAQGRFIVGVGTGTDDNLNTKTFTESANGGLYIDKNVPNHTHYIANSGTGPAGSPPTITNSNVLSYQSKGAFNEAYKLDGSAGDATVGVTSGVLSTLYNPSLSANIANTVTSLSSITNCPPSYGLYVWQRIA